jgi:riboflavin biosynthesis pyrimidine reductase
LPVVEGRPAVRLNMIASVDGATALDGRSGGLGGPAARRFFVALRSLADVVLVAAGTVRAEG